MTARVTTKNTAEVGKWDKIKQKMSIFGFGKENKDDYESDGGLQMKSEWFENVDLKILNNLTSKGKSGDNDES